MVGQLKLPDTVDDERVLTGGVARSMPGGGID